MADLRKYKNWIAGEWHSSKTTTSIVDPYTQKTVAENSLATSDQLSSGLESAHRALPEFKKTSRFLRSKLLQQFAIQIEKNRSKFVTLLIEECGKPQSFADIEVSRAIGTFTYAAEEAKRYIGELIAVDSDATGRAYRPATALLKPRGVILGITPFNFPLNLVAHKVAPALAIGAPIIVKPPPQAPGAALLLAEIFEKACHEIADSREKIPLASFQVLSATNDVASAAIKDSRVSILSFTGSHTVGWQLRDLATKKKALLELGGNASVIVHEDADISRATSRCVAGGYGYAGQTCISVQRVFVHQNIFQKFCDGFVTQVKQLKVGDPKLPDTIVGPLIDSKSVQRINTWVQEAQSAGAKTLVEGKTDGNVLTPILLTGTKSNQKVNCEEVFGPVVVVESYKEFEEAVNNVNASDFGLQAGIFTNSEKHIQLAESQLDVGGLLVNEIPTFRADHLPYGGTKSSGLGREGLRFAMEEFSERMTIVHWQG